jgi:hypothetical protein
MTRFGTDEREKEVIKQISYLKRQKKLTYEGIANVLNSRMIPSKIGRKWVPSTVRNILVGGAHRGGSL